MPQIIGREKQLATLARMLKTERPELVAVVGRRRVGKTFLVRNAYTGRLAFDLTGLQTGNTAIQLQAFHIAYNRAFPERAAEATPENWLAAFDRLATALEQGEETEKPVVFLDELPWLATPRSGFLEALGWFWNSWATKRSIVVVICGSAAAWMIRRVINDRGGLHNRVTELMHLEPFTLGETEAFCLARGIRLPRYHLLQLYMVMGGIPMYLDQLRPGRSAVENIQAICFDRDGYLRGEFSRLFASLFANYEKHVAIVRALAKRRIGLTRKALVETLGAKDGGGLTRSLDELIESGFVTVYQGYKKKRRDELYRLTDPYSLFYLTYLESLGRSSAVEFTQLSSLPSFRAWSDYAFETVCLLHVRQIRQALGISGVSTRVSSFYAKKDGERAGAQIDLLIERADDTIHLCEAKFTSTPLAINARLGEEFQKKAAVFAAVSGTTDHLLHTLLTTFPHKGQTTAHAIDRVVTLDALFRS